MVVSAEALERVVRGLAARWDWEKGPMQLEVGAWSPKRDRGDEARYRIVVRQMAQLTGHTEDEIHEDMLDRFAPREVIEVNGRQVVKTLRTGDMNVEQHAAFRLQVEAWAAHFLGIAP